MTADLPSGWEWAKLSDLGVEIRGQLTPEPGTTYDLYSVPTFSSGRPERIDGTQIKSGKRGVEPDDVLLCKINPRINRVWVVGRTEGNPQIASTEYLVLRPHEPRMSSFIQQYLSSPSFRDWIKLSVEGATGSHTRAKSGPILQQPIPVAPLAEQQRIVVAIEENLSRLDAVYTNLRSVARQTEVLEQAVINEAMRGQVHRLGDRLSEPLRNGFSPPRSSAGNTRVLTLTAVTNRAFTEDNTRTAAVPQAQRDQLTLQSGDILVQRSNTPELVGTAALYSGPSGWAVFSDLLIRVRTDHTLLPAYLEFALRSSSVRRYFRLSAQGIAGSMPKISQRTIEELEIPIPASIAEQQTIVGRVSQEIKAVMEVQAGVSSARQRADSLRRAVLAAAFAGQLVPQSPYDEPASVLLERIAASRTATPKRQKVTA
ncbi:MAG: hypothetical protein F4011_03755 [Acidimicrobiaceae bacterium]|nr:hypothetical protein [Acidimicrobiaceae bacterium]MYL03282.1 hypothetical protein [Acidimicrobiaceae bacterium]